MRRFLLAVLLLAMPSAGAPQDEHAPDVLAWFAMTPPQFGCWLENTFGHRDPKWHCGLQGWKPSGDPCDDVVPYYEGPRLPESVAKRIDPRLRGIELEWEYGRLRGVTLSFEGPIAEATAREACRLPPTGAPGGFLRIDLQRCSKAATCLVVQRFEHQGAGDVDCDAVRARRAR